MRVLVGVSIGVVALLLGWGAALDRARPLAQPVLFAGLQLASLAGAGLGVAAGLQLARGRLRPLWAGLLGLASWRLAYFPIMVFSGHVASIGEWVTAATGLLPVWVYPIFLVSVAALHAGAALVAGWLVAPPFRAAPLLVAPAFLVAALVSFNQLSDLRLLPDTVVRLDAPVPPMRTGGANPYLPALTGPGYLPNQRVVLLAAGLTYETIPPSPWATTVKAVLEGLFNDKPHGSTMDRVREHYLAYHSAHPLVGCRRLADCPSAP